jgi:hypothetical protein
MLYNSVFEHENYLILHPKEDKRSGIYKNESISFFYWIKGLLYFLNIAFVSFQ